MPKSDFVSYLKTLKSEDWNKMATDKWTIKDVVAHMVGWEAQDPQSLREAWENKEPPWWMKTKKYDEFNQKAVEHYKNYTPEELIAEWETCQQKFQDEMDRIGEDNLKAYPDLFGYFTDGRNGKHYQHHLQQIKDAVGKKHEQEKESKS